jgi:hypothetical protein
MGLNAMLSRNAAAVRRGVSASVVEPDNAIVGLTLSGKASTVTSATAGSSLSVSLKFVMRSSAAR